MRLLRTRLSHLGKAALLVAAGSALAGPAAAAMVITEISFSGHGHVTSSDGPRAPRRGTSDNISADIIIHGAPYIYDNASGIVIDVNGDFKHPDTGNVSFYFSDNWAHGEAVWFPPYPGSGLSGYASCLESCGARVVLSNGHLLGANLWTSGEVWSPNITGGPDGISVFSGSFYDPGPEGSPDQIYSGVWQVEKITITTESIPEPATWALTLIGFGLMGGALRRARRWAVPAA
jgi:hypothetical protein